MAKRDGMRFRNFGGIYQFVVSDAHDLERIDALDPARWAATSAPLCDLHCDPGFLAALDPEGTGRVRVSQLVEARDWLFVRLAGRNRLKERTDVLRLADLDDAREPGQKLLAAAQEVMRALRLGDAKTLALADVRTFRSGYQKMLANGDGVVPAEGVADPEVQQAIKEIVGVTGGTKDASGSDGIGRADLDRFVAAARGWLAWRAKDTPVRPWGSDTEAAFGLVEDLDAKIEEYFWQCDLLRQEKKTAEGLGLKEDELRALWAQDGMAIERYLAASPLALPTAAGRLPLTGGDAVNPVYRDRFAALCTEVLARAPGEAAAPAAGESLQGVMATFGAALGGTSPSLSRDRWRAIKQTFAAWRAWRADKPKENFDDLGEERVKALIEGALPGKILQLIERDQAAAASIVQVADLEKLILLQRWLIDLVNNFVNFSAIYQPDVWALVETGSLVIDGRRLDFCLRVTDRAAHKRIAADSLIYLAYAYVFAKDGSTASYEVVAPVTGGERGRLRVGKRGIFIDVEGKEWDAQIMDIVEAPISVREAMFAPFRRVSQFLNKKIEGWVDSAQKAQEKALLTHAQKTTDEAEKAADKVATDAGKVASRPADLPAGRSAPETIQAKPGGKGLDVNSLILGGGIALGGLAAVLGAVFGLLATLKGWIAVAGLVAAVLALSGLVGWIRLRKRDMSFLFEANGWALNISMRINRRISRVFTWTPALPKGSVIERFDVLATREDRAAELRGRMVTVAFFAAIVVLVYWWFWLGHPLPSFVSHPFTR